RRCIGPTKSTATAGRAALPVELDRRLPATAGSLLGEEHHGQHGECGRKDRDSRSHRGYATAAGHPMSNRPARTGVRSGPRNTQGLKNSAPTGGTTPTGGRQNGTDLARALFVTRRVRSSSIGVEAPRSWTGWAIRFRTTLEVV